MTGKALRLLSKSGGAGLFGLAAAPGTETAVVFLGCHEIPPLVGYVIPGWRIREGM